MTTTADQITQTQKRIDETIETLLALCAEMHELHEAADAEDPDAV